MHHFILHISSSNSVGISAEAIDLALYVAILIFFWQLDPIRLFLISLLSYYIFRCLGSENLLLETEGPYLWFLSYMVKEGIRSENTTLSDRLVCWIYSHSFWDRRYSQSAASNHSLFIVLLGTKTLSAVVGFHSRDIETSGARMGRIQQTELHIRPVILRNFRQKCGGYFSLRTHQECI